jgi:glutaredoxin-like YruB-family protein
MPFPVVKIYSTPTCPNCMMAKEFLKQNGVPFVEINVAEDKQAAWEMIKKTGQTSLPVIEVNGSVIIGFDEELLKKKLNLK